jgi:hypothetical protein
MEDHVAIVTKKLVNGYIQECMEGINSYFDPTESNRQKLEV